MLKKTLEQLINLTKNKAICALTVNRDIKDVIAVSLSGDLDMQFEYTRNAIKGIYYITPDSATFYTPKISTNSLYAVQTLKDFAQKKFGQKEKRDMRVLDYNKISDIVHQKFIDHGLKNLVLKTIPADKKIKCDILGLQTETSALVMGMQYQGLRPINYSIGRGNSIQRGEI